MPQQSSYSNYKAMLALVRASLQASIKNPSAIVFTIAFPLVFILVFGFLGGERQSFIGVTLAPGSDTTLPLYRNLQQAGVLQWMDIQDTAEQKKMMAQGELAATVSISKPQGQAYDIHIQGSGLQQAKVQQLQAIIKSALQNADPEITARTEQLADISVEIATVREFKTIDFILPGQLGFSLLAGSVFGTAFIFLNLRETLVLKRFYATPVRREVIVLSEGVARMLYQLMGAVVIIGVGYFAFGYTLINGIFTFLGMILLSALGILVFMGFGFIISSIARSPSTVPPLSNIVTLPQFLLAGTFFPIEVFPEWLQPFCRVLPLTYLNDALRKIAFEGAGLAAISTDILILLLWGVVLYVVAGRVFKWE